MVRRAIAVLAMCALAACTEEQDLPSEDSYWRTKGTTEYSLISRERDYEPAAISHVISIIGGVVVNGRPQLANPKVWWRTWFPWAGQVIITKSSNVSGAHIKLDTLFSAENLAAHGLKPMMCFYSVSRYGNDTMHWIKRGGTEHCPGEVILEGRK